MTTATKLNKVLHIGNIPDQGRLFVKVEIREDGELSISGVIGPLANGNARGGCGQIDMEFQHRNPADNDHRYGPGGCPLTKASAIEYAPNWNREKWLDLLDIWTRWHLNHMKANCEHQTGPEWDAGKMWEIVTYNMTSETLTEHNRIKAAAMKGLETTGQVKLTPHDQYILALSWELKRPAEQPLTADLSKLYKERSRESRAAGWLYPKDHPEGLLTKPCPECDYNYGSAWLKEELPADVVEFLGSLPDTDMTPAWI